jgi:Holliday junction resolvase-like predicted endonuclease
MTVTITKASGREENFDIKKLISSLIRSGAPQQVAEEIAQEVEQQTVPLARTGDIYRRAKKLLRKFNHASGMRYSIKQAIFSLGPSGYPFEKFFGKVLSRYGYVVETDRSINGFCVSHEVDVIARNDDTYTFIECKYHSDGGKATDVKTALYVHARFQDIKKAVEKDTHERMIFRDGWLVTNTRCTSDAIQYAECAGLRIISWRYPEKGSLERMIEDKRLYPVTILHSVRKGMLDPLFRADIILAQDIADMDMEAFVRKSGLDEHSARILKKEADAVCPCTKP